MGRPWGRDGWRQVAKYVCRARCIVPLRMQIQSRPAASKKKASRRYKARPIRSSRTIVARNSEAWREGLRAERGGFRPQAGGVGGNLVLWGRRHLVGAGIRWRRWQRNLSCLLERSNPDG